MDFKSIVEAIDVSACIISVELTEDRSCGDVRLVEANGLYKGMMHGFSPGMIYSELVPKDLKFEDYCYRAAIKKQRMHAYVDTKGLNVWSDYTMIPLAGGNDKKGYCLFIIEVTDKAEPDRQADVSIDVAKDVISTCIKLRDTNDYRTTMNECMEDIRKLCDADSCCILAVDWKAAECDIIAMGFDKMADTAMPEPEKQRKDFYQVVKTWPQTIGVSNCLIVKDKHDMDEIMQRNSMWAKSLESAGVKTVVLFPLISANNTVGYIWATNFDVKKTVKIKETLELTAYFLGAEVANHNLLNELERISSMDLLTGVYNRNAMNYRVDSYVKGKDVDNFGVVFMDLNGLKHANDTQGHVAGDKLLKRAVEIIAGVFSDVPIYRAGGDEFVLIEENISQDEFIEKIRILKEKTGDTSEISLAIGSYYDEDGRDIRYAMHVADERMYEDKKDYYNRHPRLER